MIAEDEAEDRASMATISIKAEPTPVVKPPVIKPTPVAAKPAAPSNAVAPNPAIKTAATIKSISADRRVSNIDRLKV